MFESSWSHVVFPWSLTNAGGWLGIFLFQLRSFSLVLSICRCFWIHGYTVFCLVSSLVFWFKLLGSVSRVRCWFGETVVPCLKLRECMLFFREVHGFCWQFSLSFHLCWSELQFSISFLAVFFLVFCFGLFFDCWVVVVGCGLCMKNQSQLCLGRNVAHGVTCEAHKFESSVWWNGEYLLDLAFEASRNWID